MARDLADITAGSVGGMTASIATLPDKLALGSGIYDIYRKTSDDLNKPPRKAP